MKKYVFQLAALMSLAFTMNSMAQDKCSLFYNGKNYVVYDMKSTPDGNIKIQAKKGQGWQIIPKDTIKKGSIKYPKSKTEAEFRKLKSALKKKSKSALSISRTLTDKYKYLGWGGYPAYIQGNLLLKAGKIAEAKRVFSAMRDYDAKAYTKEGYMGEATCMLKSGQLKVDSPIMNDLIASSGKYAGFAFNEKGKLFEAKGRLKDAAREYMKGTMLTDPKTGADIAAESRKNLKAILVKMKDNRAKDF